MQPHSLDAKYFYFFECKLKSSIYFKMYIISESKIEKKFILDQYYKFICKYDRHTQSFNFKFKFFTNLKYIKVNILLYPSSLRICLVCQLNN